MDRKSFLLTLLRYGNSIDRGMDQSILKRSQ